MIARVARNGSTPPRIIKPALIRPTNKPIPRPAATGNANADELPGASDAAITPLRPTIDPTDKSIPAVIMTKVIPSAIKPIIED